MRIGILNLTGAGLCICALVLAQSEPPAPVVTSTPVVTQSPEPPSGDQKNIESHTMVINPVQEDQAQEPHDQVVQDYAHRIATGDATAEAELTDKHDIDFDCEIGWLLYNRHFPNLALDLFQQALSWNAAETQAKQGLFYCYKSMGDDSLALPYLTSLSADQQASEKHRMASTTFARTPVPTKKVTPAETPTPPVESPTPSIAQMTSTEPTSVTPLGVPQVIEPQTPIITAVPPTAPPTSTPADTSSVPTASTPSTTAPVTLTDMPPAPPSDILPGDKTPITPTEDVEAPSAPVIHHRHYHLRQASVVSPPQYQPLTETKTQTTQTESHYSQAAPTGDNYIQQAVTDNQNKDYDGAISNLAKSEAKHPLTRGLRIMRAWIYFNQKRYGLSLSEFEKLYKEHPDQATAQGLYVSSENYDHYETIAKNPAFNQGEMGRVIEDKRYDDYYGHALYLNAYDLEPNRDPGLANLDAPWLGGDLAYRYKDGTSGEGQISEIIFPTVEGGYNITPIDQVHASIARFSADAGSLAPNALYGTAPLVPTPESYKAITDYSDLFVPEIDYHHEGYTTYNAQFGLTPLNAVIAPLPTGKLEVIKQLNGGAVVSGELYSESNKESLLSYAGVRDPYTGRDWGRVVEAGIRGTAYVPLGRCWGIYAQGGYGDLVGDNVRDNTHLYVSASLGRKIDWPDYFEYLTVGPTIGFETFDNNQDFYTFGNGGYFSPKSIEEGGLAVSYLTKESRRFLSDGYLSIGYQTNEQDSEPYLPLSPDGRNYPSMNGQSMIFSTHIRVAYLLTNRWQIGGFFTYSKSADYNEAIIGVAAKYYFDDRTALFRTDLPTIP